MKTTNLSQNNKKTRVTIPLWSSFFKLFSSKNTRVYLDSNQPINNCAQYNTPPFSTTPTAIPVYSLFRMLARWPEEIIHPVITFSGVSWPFAMFSPAVLYCIPERTVDQLLPFGLVCVKDMYDSSARISTALCKALTYSNAGILCYERGFFWKTTCISTEKGVQS